MSFWLCYLTYVQVGYKLRVSHLTTLLVLGGFWLVACSGTENSKDFSPLQPQQQGATQTAGSGGSSPVTDQNGSGNAGDVGEGKSGQGQGSGAPNDPSAWQSCPEQVAWSARAMVFAFPTPPELAMTLNQLFYDPKQPVLSVVFRNLPQNQEPLLGVSACESDQLSRLVFPTNMGPDFAPVWGEHGVMRTKTPQNLGFLRITDLAQQVHDIHLEHVNIQVSPTGDCSSAMVFVDAQIPVNDGNVSLNLGESSRTLEELGGKASSSHGSKTHWPIRIWFQASSSEFDFQSIP
jgi:hypothetical protein